MSCFLSRLAKALLFRGGSLRRVSDIVNREKQQRNRVIEKGLVPEFRNSSKHFANTASPSANSITVQSTGKETKTTTVSIIPSTMFMRSGTHVSLKDLKIGERVVIEAKENKDGKLEAISVTFGKPQPRSGMGDMPGMDMSK
jgi:hypothetical protein